ncbi:trigger factor [Pseudonocardia eucalypti]|uniref:Trigger factor n=1 Tax=Pseudonocardia eucalypti TaxID=648755 RepID=A0ABP9Q0J8_9PSEU|nr:trigger factor [Pseudonocardia eucalypti]
MKSTVEQLSPTRVKLNVEVPFDELKPNFDRAYRKLAQQVNIPGFRKGKAPARILEARLGRGVVLDEVVNEAIPAKYSEAVIAGSVRVLGQPEIEVTELKDGEQVAFTAEVDIRPEFDLPDAAAITVEVDAPEVADEEVTEQLDQLRGRFGTLTGVERPAAEDDFVSIDLAAEVDGEALEEAQTSGMSYQVGSGGMIEGLDEAITGLSGGESKTFTTKLVAGEHAEKDAEVTVKVTSVKVRELPEADDDFAQLASEFDTLDELTADLRRQLTESKRVRQTQQAREKVLEALLEAAEVPLPEGIVAAETESRTHEVVHAFDHDEARLAEFLEKQGLTKEKFESDARENAERSVKTQLLLDAIAEAAEVQVTESELIEQIVAQSQRFGMSPEEFVQRAQQAGQLGAVEADVRRGKALDSVVRQVKVTDSSGAEVDLSEFLSGAERGDETAESQDDAEQTGEKAEEPAGAKA